MGRNQPCVKMRARRASPLEGGKLELSREACGRPVSARNPSSWHGICLTVSEARILPLPTRPAPPRGRFEEVASGLAESQSEGGGEVTRLVWAGPFDRCNLHGPASDRRGRRARTRRADDREARAAGRPTAVRCLAFVWARTELRPVLIARGDPTRPRRCRSRADVIGNRGGEAGSSGCRSMSAASTCVAYLDARRRPRCWTRTPPARRAECSPR
jgi:hypothetical protein